jgi:hypothetical protein
MLKSPINNDILQLQAYLTGISTHKDGGLGIRIETQELNTDSKIRLLEFVGKFGWFLFRPSDISFTIEDVPKYNPEQWDETKSPSTRLRAVLFRLWEKDNLGFVDYESYYRSRMEKIIIQLKNKL